MKKSSVSVVVCILMFCFLSSAQADSWKLSPGGEFVVNGMDQVTFDLSYINDGEVFLSDNWGANLWFDELELNPVSISTELGLITEGNIVDGLYKIAGFGMFDAATIGTGENLLASITFDILDPDQTDQVVAYDLKMVTDPSGITGITESNFGPLHNGTLALGADVVTSPVPVPGAVFLLSPGLVALAWGRRKFKRTN